MPDYPLSLTASEIDAALQKASNPDTEPQQNDNLITSGGVKTYVDGAVGDLAGKTVTTEATGIENTDNDTSIPTSAAVKAYVDVAANASLPTVVNFNGTRSGGNGNIPASIVYSNTGAVDTGTVITIPTGSYLYSISGIPDTLTYRQELFLNNLRVRLGSGWSDSRPVSPLSGILYNISSVYLYAQVYGSSGAAITVNNAILSLTRLA